MNTTAGAMRAAKRMQEIFLVGGYSDANVRYAAEVISKETADASLLAACKFFQKYVMMQNAKGNALPSQLVGAVYDAIAEADGRELAKTPQPSTP